MNFLNDDAAGLLYQQLQPTALDLDTCATYGVHIDFAPLVKLYPC